MPESAQEAFVAEMLEHSLGAPYLFEPDEYVMGTNRQKVREPADLVWWCRDTAIVMCLTASERATAEAADYHNFGVFEGGCVTGDSVP